MKKNDYYDTEIRRIDLQRKNLLDHYNTLEEKPDLTKCDRLVEAKLEYSPRKHELWTDYAKNLKIHIAYAQKKNYKAHIDPPKGCWYTHRSPLGCFMCEDMELIHYMLKVIEYMGETHPKQTF